MTPLVLQRLRTATQAAHDSLEQALDIFSHLRVPARRRRLVARFQRLHEAADRQLDPWLAQVRGLEFHRRSRAELFRQDVAELGARVAAEPDPPGPQVDGVPAALGLFYVLEGSTLGGRVIARRLASEGIGGEGLRFLDPYGPQAGERWRAFIDVLARETEGPGEVDAAVKAAVEGFGWVRESLCGPAGERSAA